MNPYPSELITEIGMLDKRISKIDPDVDPGLYHELVFYRDELEAEYLNIRLDNETN